MRILTIALTLLLAGCATAPVNISATPQERYALPVGEVVVSNFAQPAEIRVADRVFKSGFTPIGDARTEPPFVLLVGDRLDQQFVAAGGEGSVDISLLKADLLIQNRFIQSIPIVGVVALFLDYDHLCHIEANFRYGDRSVRRTFEAGATLPLAWSSDKDAAQIQQFVEGCLADVFSDMHEFSLTLLN